MAIVGSSVIAGSKATVLEIFNIPLGAIDTEQSQVLSTGPISGYIIKTRGTSLLKLTHTSGESGTKYMTIEGCSSFEDSNRYSNLTIYFQSPQTGDTVEIWVWKA